jgi:NTE family protein
MFNLSEFESDEPHRTGNGPHPGEPPIDGPLPGVALALGGGFAKGFAHLGVLEVLEQAGIPIAAIVGTSIGGLIGAAYADGIPLDEICALGRAAKVRDFLRFQKAGLKAKGCDHIGQFLLRFRANRVESLRIPTAIVATDVKTHAPHIFTTGPLEVAMRATCAFPGLFSPVEHEGRAFADGCLVAPVPAFAAAGVPAACVLGVGLHADDATASRSWMAHADVIVEPEVERIAWSDFSRADEARAKGAEAMRRTLPNVIDLLARRARQEPRAHRICTEQIRLAYA